MIYIITGGRSSGKTETLKYYYDNADNPFGFLLSKKTENGFITGYDLYNPGTGEKSALIAEKKDAGNVFQDFEQNRRFIFNNRIFNYACKQYEKEIPFHSSLFLDETGSLEFEKHKGFYNTLLLLLENSDNKDIYLTVSDSCLHLLLNLIRKRNLQYIIIRKKNIAAVIMASGKSKRFGNENKLLKKINGKALYQITLENVIKSDIFSNIFIVTAYDEILKGALKYWNVCAVYNKENDRGLSETVKKGVKASDASGADGYMFIPADQVLVSPGTINKLASVFLENSRKIIVPVSNGNRKGPSVFSSVFSRQLLNLNGDAGGKTVADNNCSSVIEVEFQCSCDFIDIDTLESYNTVKNILETD